MHVEVVSDFGRVCFECMGFSFDDDGDRRGYRLYFNGNYTIIINIEYVDEVQPKGDYPIRKISGCKVDYNQPMFSKLDDNRSYIFWVVTEIARLLKDCTRVSIKHV